MPSEHPASDRPTRTDDRRRSRRSVLQATGGLAAAGLTGSLAGCGGLRSTPTPVGAEVGVVSFHWGHRLVGEAGTAVRELSLEQGTRVRITAINSRAVDSDAYDRMADDIVAETLGKADGWRSESVERVAAELGEEEGYVQERLHEALRNADTHGLAVTGPDGEERFSARLPPDTSTPERAVVHLDVAGEYDLACTVDCGLGHPYHRLDGALVVE